MLMKPPPARIDLAQLVKGAVARYEAMTPEEQAAHDKAQRESWVRGEMALGLDDDRHALQPKQVSE